MLDIAKIFAEIVQNDTNENASVESPGLKCHENSKAAHALGEVVEEFCFCPKCDTQLSASPCQCGVSSLIFSVMNDCCSKLLEDIQFIIRRSFASASEGVVDLAINVDNLLASVEMRHLESRGWKLKKVVSDFLKSILRGEISIQIDTTDLDANSRGDEKRIKFTVILECNICPFMLLI